MNVPEAEAAPPPAPARKMSSLILGSVSVVMLYAFQALFYGALVPMFAKMFFVNDLTPPAFARRLIGVSESFQTSLLVAVPLLFVLATAHIWCFWQPQSALRRFAGLFMGIGLGLSVGEIAVLWYYIFHLKLLTAPTSG